MNPSNTNIPELNNRNTPPEQSTADHQTAVTPQASDAGCEQPRYRIAVSGNPNAGKTSVFNALTGGNQTVGNYPGVTVEKKEGSVTWDGDLLHFVDLPGTYSLTAYSMDEIAARDYVIEEQPDVVIQVVDAANLERNLYLTTQLLELEAPMVLALNMVDVARSHGTRIDAEKLEAQLGIPVVKTIGNRRKGIGELLAAAKNTATRRRRGENIGKDICFDRELEGHISALSGKLSAEDLAPHAASRWTAIKLLEEDDEVQKDLKKRSARFQELEETRKKSAHDIEEIYGDDPPAVFAMQRYEMCARIAEASTSVVGGDIRTLTDRIDSVVCHRIVGMITVIACIYALFKAVFFFSEDFAWVPFWHGEFVWQTPKEVVALLFEDWLPMLFSHMSDGALKSLIQDGVLAGVGGVMEFAPLIFIMFFFLAILEDSGYIARIAFVMDRALYTFGLQGKSIVALIVSGGIAGGCAVPGVMATRTLREENDRLTTMLVTPFMNCGAKMPVYAILIGAFFSAYKGEMLLFLILLSWSLALLAALILRKTVIKGEQTPFVMEMPPYHRPDLRSVLYTAGSRCWLYVKKAGTIILGVNVVMWAIMYFPQQEKKQFFNERRHAAEEMIQQAELPMEHLSLFSGENLPQTRSYLTECSRILRNSSSLSQAEKRIMKEAGGKNNRYRLAKNLLLDSYKEKTDDSSLENFHNEMGKNAPLQISKPYQGFRKRMYELDEKAAAHQLKHSIAGVAGRAITPVTELAGFEWKTNIALIGGFAAKEIIVSTLGSAYSLSAANPPGTYKENGKSSDSRLVQRIRADWSPLQAFTLMIFVMIYAPCVVTITVLGREAGHWKWALFSTGYNTLLAFCLAVLVYQTGSALGIGI